MTDPSDNCEYYNLPETLDRDELLRELRSEHNFAIDTEIKKKEEFVDTFDRRLYHQNLLLLKEGGSYFLKNLNSSDTIAVLSAKGRTNLKFWWDLPQCRIREILKPCIDIRALLSLAKIEKSVVTLRLLNEDEKTILFVYLKDIKVLGSKDKNPSTILQTKAVRGYELEAREFNKYLLTLGLKPSGEDLLSVTAPNAHYSSKINVKLKANMKTVNAMQLIFENLLSTIRANEFGIKEDIDTEFLHDFRVAVRRTRSALTQVKGVFAKDVTDKYKESFSKIGKATNLLRDLDVYLLTKNSYKDMLPQDLRSGLDPLYETLVQDRDKACRECGKFLESSGYKEILKQWEEFLNSSGASPQEAPDCELPIIEVAKKHIWKKYSKVIKMGSKIESDTPSPMLHMLRIECKKLRYLLEFFSSLFSEKETTLAIKHLKKLQDNLGDFNDLYFQQESLKSFLNNAENGYDVEQNDTQVAIGGLISVLYQRQIGARKRFAANFKEFCDKETSALFTKLFAGD